MSGSLICKLFSHKWGDEQYVSERSCEKVRTCQRCGNKETEVVHLGGEWDESDDYEKVRTCQRCGDKETEVYELKEGGPYSGEKEYAWLGSDKNARV